MIFLILCLSKAVTQQKPSYIPSPSIKPVIYNLSKNGRIIKVNITDKDIRKTVIYPVNSPRPVPSPSPSPTPMPQIKESKRKTHYFLMFAIVFLIIGLNKSKVIFNKYFKSKIK